MMSSGSRQMLASIISSSRNNLKICLRCARPIPQASSSRINNNQRTQSFSTFTPHRAALQPQHPRTSPTTPPIPKLPSHKPPKRRMEAASQPLRNSPSTTRGPILQCIAHTTAERYDLVSLGHLLKQLGVKYDEVPEGDRDRAFVIGPWKGRGGAERLISGKDIRTTLIEEEDIYGKDEGKGEEREERDEMGFGYGNRGEIWVFNTGSFVTWGLTEEEGRAFLREVIRKKGKGLSVERGGLTNSEYEVEEVDFVVDPTAKTHIMGNMILLGAPPSLSTFHPSPSLASLLGRYTLSLALSRSSSLSVLEDRLDTHITSVSTLPLSLSRYGQQPMSRISVIRKIGELMSLRMALNTSGGGLSETPEFYWSEPILENYFDSILKEFEIKERINMLNKKIDYAQEVQSTLRALLTEASGHRMEIIIIALIAVEVVLALIREGPELKDLLVVPIWRAIKELLGVQSTVRQMKSSDQTDGGSQSSLESHFIEGILSQDASVEFGKGETNQLSSHDIRLV